MVFNDVSGYRSISGHFGIIPAVFKRFLKRSRRYQGLPGTFQDVLVCFKEFQGHSREFQGFQ